MLAYDVGVWQEKVKGSRRRQEHVVPARQQTEPWSTNQWRLPLMEQASWTVESGTRLPLIKDVELPLRRKFLVGQNTWRASMMVSKGKLEAEQVPLPLELEVKEGFHAFRQQKSGTVREKHGHEQQL